MRYLEIGPEPEVEGDLQVLTLTPVSATNIWTDAWTTN